MSDKTDTPTEETAETPKALIFEDVDAALMAAATDPRKLFEMQLGIFLDTPQEGLQVFWVLANSEHIAKQVALEYFGVIRVITKPQRQEMISRRWVQLAKEKEAGSLAPDASAFDDMAAAELSPEGIEADTVLVGASG